MLAGSANVGSVMGETHGMGLGTGTQPGLGTGSPNMGLSLGTLQTGAMLQGTGAGQLNGILGTSVHSQTASSARLQGLLPNLTNDLQTIRVQLLVLKDRMAEEAELPSNLKSEYKKAILDVVEVVNSLQSKEQQTRRTFDKLMSDETARTRDEVSRVLKAKDSEVDEMKAKVLSFARQFQAKYTLQSQLCDEALKTMTNHLRNKEHDDLKSNIKDFLKNQFEHRNLRYRLQSQLSSVRKPQLESERRRELGDYSACQESKGDEIQLLNCLEANRLQVGLSRPRNQNLGLHVSEETPSGEQFILETPKATERHVQRLQPREHGNQDYHHFILSREEQENMLTFKQGHQLASLGDKGLMSGAHPTGIITETRVLKDLARSRGGNQMTPDPKSSAKKQTFTSDEYDMPDFTINSSNKKKNVQIDSARIADKFDFSGTRGRELEEADIEDVLGARSLPISLKGSSTFQ